ncbi:MAG: MBL fold metallo-hydrolase [Desulfovibrio sp.]|uniref:MBL fold metallo-hydrolase n=1 Tax=Desulfovibrio sp. TaxID=885 RepID=UPI0025BD86D1|nr:MBL fold metallo-hydrolase [Desulfovibrio sp.]MCI7568630.1 MBL fold metallo-hydrolase [Desulfovibrio sp.]
MAIETFPLGPLQTNSYLVHADGMAVAVDVGGDPAPMLDFAAANGLRIADIVLTHLHFDHVYGVAALAAATGAAVHVPPHDRCLLETESGKGGIWGFPPVPAYDGEDIARGDHTLGGMACTILDTPGHTPGGISIYFPAEKAVFCGDALFHRSIGRTDFPGGDHAQLLRSIRERLFALPPETVVYPGHGPVTTIGDERKNNPFCGDFAE